MRFVTVLILQGILLLIFGCGQGSSDATRNSGSSEAVQDEPNKKDEPAGPDTAIFAETFDQFFNALQAGDTAVLNSFIDAQQGFWLIEQPGAMPAYTHFRNVQEAHREYQSLPFLSISKEMQQCLLQRRQALPTFDCANMLDGQTGFTEDGCFYTTHTTEFQHSDMWQYASLGSEQAEQVQEMQRQADASVLHTQSYFRFYFGYRNSRWQLLFADLRVPCSA